ncbi:MAG: hypothetical protein QOG53_404 [Frankiales bacterium]|jgi:hypothetical protein|nr:hypothetical protein [Frankiales bacterium]
MTRVAYVGGVIRSGSTLLDRMLGELPGHVAVGELCYIWEHSVLLNHNCGCGEAFSDCPFWTAVGEQAFGGWGAIDAEQIVALQASVDTTRDIPRLLTSRGPSDFAQRVQHYLEVLTNLYRGIAETAGARVVVDSSKHAGPAYLLRRAPDVDLRVVHIVRDPRGVANSLRKKVKRPERDGFEDYMSTWPARTVARRWLTTNSLISSMTRLGVSVTRVRYEDLVSNPHAELSRIAAAVDEPLQPGALDFIADGAVKLPSAHTLDGNPMRFTTGPMQLRPDEGWRTALPESDRRLVEVSTWPLRRAYGYRN